MKRLPLLSPLKLSDMVRTSRFSLGKRVRAKGVPAILLGAAAIVVAAAAGRAIERTVSVGPETLREAREFWLAVRGGHQPETKVRPLPRRTAPGDDP